MKLCLVGSFRTQSRWTGISRVSVAMLGEDIMCIEGLFCFEGDFDYLELGRYRVRGNRLGLGTIQSFYTNQDLGFLLKPKFVYILSLSDLTNLSSLQSSLTFTSQHDHASDKHEYGKPTTTDPIHLWRLAPKSCCCSNKIYDRPLKLLPEYYTQQSIG